MELTVGWFQDFKDWLRDALLWAPKAALEWLLDKVAELIEAIPVPDWLSGAGSVFAAVPGEVVWFLDAFAINYGIGIIIAAYIVRFLIRRIPVVG